MLSCFRDLIYVVKGSSFSRKNNARCLGGMHHEGVKFVQIRRNTTCSGINEPPSLGKKRELVKVYLRCQRVCRELQFDIQQFFLLLLLDTFSIYRNTFQKSGQQPEPIFCTEFLSTHSADFSKHILVFCSFW
eukprot:TRINITY_DN3546_c1_g1_i3.p5 TRINITY_DN3546_c1_g1~~TRINITY_DN3546_c1_g1_i3.p5  ORF type:complete len:132 (-),score=9.07 TRINITY_DN3546_c1_g1_i3:153-548(-)